VISNQGPRQDSGSGSGASFLEKVPMPTTARLRQDLDRGRGGDKVRNIDPAAAPLGTDDEAAGTSPTAAQIKLAYHHEIGKGMSSEQGDDHGVAIYIAIVLLWSCTLLSAIYFVRPY
jgi:hypothetical protein